MNIAKFTRNFFIVIVAMILIAIFARVYMMEDNDLLSELQPTENAISVYGNKGAEGFMSHSPAEDLTHDGYYSANGMVYIESAKELQVTARYNDSLYGYLGTEDKTQFTYTILDKTNGKVYEGKVVEQGEKYMYNYDKLVFENLEITEDSELYLFLHYEDKYPVEDESKGLLLHHSDQEFKKYKLSKDEIAELTE